MRDRACHLFTLLGTAGVGKSRLVEEFVATVPEGTVVRGRCLSYGEGITYLPVVEVVKQLCGAEPAAGIAELAVDEHVAAVVSALLNDVAPVAPAEETAWAVRKLLEAAASSTPLVVVLDDLQWGEPTFLDLVEHIADWSRDAPILILCMARPEFLDHRPSWGGGKLNASTILLEALSSSETDQLIEQRLGTVTLTDDLRDRIRETAEGNPLFVEQMLALLAESSAGELVVPPTIQALLAARLDHLDPAERAVLARGAVEGRVFHRGAVSALSAELQDLDPLLMGLVRKELVRPVAAQVRGEDAFRFRHQLIRDAAYDGLSKQDRAALHESFAAWLAAAPAGVADRDELLGYHLEQAYRYRAALGNDRRTRRRACVGCS